MGNGKFCTSPNPKLPYQYGKQNRHLIPIADLENSYCWCQQCYLIIWTIGIVDIKKVRAILLSIIGIVDISIVRTLLISTYPHIQMSISLMRNRNNTNCINKSNCRYRQIELLIAVMDINVDIDIQIAVINTAICWCWHLELSIITMYMQCWYHLYTLSISLIPIVNIENWYNCVHVLLISVM